MASPTPRFEFRAFAQGFERVETVLRARAGFPEITESRERYLLGTSGAAHNVKARDGHLEIKRRIEVRDGLERWEPVARQAFPLPARFVSEELLPELGCDADPGDNATWTLDAFCAALRWPRGTLFVANVFKRRFRFELEGCPAEIDQLLVNGAAIRSAAVESEDAVRLGSLVESLGLGGFENVGYPLAWRRVLGLETWPGEEEGPDD
ncbi:MAG: hypothetical protein R3298_05230 [Gammaproteobacteria bacterium]|nr:hypothetical protein [Gammaproteobacteria bacterium]